MSEVLANWITPVLEWPVYLSLSDVSPQEPPGAGDPTSSYPTAGMAFVVLEAHKLPHPLMYTFVKVVIHHRRHTSDAKICEVDDITNFSPSPLMTSSTQMMLTTLKTTLLLLWSVVHSYQAISSALPVFSGESGLKSNDSEDAVNLTVVVLFVIFDSYTC